ncbi:Zn-dependent exopeptidase [Massarina eburnea CBS 473.64]|uniref:Zn-dependent exopeptidase n=1 Tax=Massarina eburnea CBS 473.64 TaxID=1395130 RepID=A0A6A6RLI2_9PLEO|nr:Zn-dependent exopeptidase [Massarina eburnea CBS 473.64]
MLLESVIAFIPRFLSLFLQAYLDSGQGSRLPVDETLLESISAKRLRRNLAYVSSFAHVAGTPGGTAIAKWIENELQLYGFQDVHTEHFDVYLNHPRKDGGRRVAIVTAKGVQFEAQLDEESVYKDRIQPSVFHGYSTSANVTGHLVYANYGTVEDFTHLKDMGIRVSGAIVLVRYYQGDPASKTRRAELAGAAGCLLFSDPQDDGFVRGTPFPKGPYRPSDGVLQSSVIQSSFVVGDPLSPGFPSVPGSARYPRENSSAFNKIPSLPLSWRDASHLLHALEGHGQPLAGTGWAGGVRDFEWWTGDENSPTVLLQNILDENDNTPIYNVLAEIPGWEQKEKVIVLGNHHDAWCFGAADAGSGIAVFLEVARAFAALAQSGWRPRRTIRFASWDAEEYNLVGSTEHVEARIESLRSHGVAYVNVDVAVSGDTFVASGSTMLKSVLYKVLEQVRHPKSNASMLQEWKAANGTLTGLSDGSDYVAFQDLAGMSSIDVGFTSAGPQAFPYHSCYDCFEWMANFGDPSFEYHKAMAQVLALLIWHLADDAFVPLDLVSYAQDVIGYVKDLSAHSSKTELRKDLDLDPLHQAAELFYRNARIFEEADETISSIGQCLHNQTARLMHNDKTSLFESMLLDPKGMPGREQFKHIIYSPQAWPGDNAFFPGPRDAINIVNLTQAQLQIHRAACILSNASNALLL